MSKYQKRPWTRRPKVKFIQSWSLQTDWVVSRLAKNRRISVVEMLRAVIIPDWLEDQKAIKGPKRKRR